MSNTEEDIKNKIILPHLKAIGILNDEVTFEHSFKVIVGKNKSSTGRYDILCKRNGLNLFVIEVKKDSVEISDKDIDQGISYARLVHPIAPYVIVSNGIETKIIDTISKEELKNIIDCSSDSLKEGLKEDIISFNLRYEAIQNFIGYSSNNLEAFCSSNIDSNIRGLRGNSSDRSKKYIPELFYSREDLINEFNNFLTDEKKCFAILGESGIGKTNCMCDLAQNLLKENIVLFLNGTLLNKPILDKIKDDFNWFFSENLEGQQIVKRLVGFNNRIKRKICIFIDAIDEVSLDSFELNLNDLVSNTQVFEDIKIIVSCKTFEWDNFLAVKGVDTDIKSNVYQYGDSFGYTLKRFNTNELKNLEDKYRTFYDLKGNFNYDIEKNISLGIFLRVLGEVYEGIQLPESIDNMEIFRKYLDKKIEKFEDGKKITAKRTLLNIGKILIENDEEFSFRKKSGLAKEEKVIESLGLGLNEQILPELFEHYILIRTYEDEIAHISFYFDKFRDYIITTLSFELQNKSKEDFQQLLTELMKGVVGQSVVSFYSSFCINEHKDAIKEYYIDRATDYLESYENIIHKNFKSFKNKFDPYTDNQIGLLILDTSNLSWFSYGFTPDLNVTHKIQIVPEDKFDSLNRMENPRMFTCRYGVRNFLTTTHKKIASKEIIGQLEKIIKKEELNESNNVAILTEKLLGSIYCYENQNEPPHELLPDFKKYLPLNINQVLQKFKPKSEINYPFPASLSEKNSIYTLAQQLLNFSSIINEGILPINDLPFKSTRGNWVRNPIVGDFEDYDFVPCFSKTLLEKYVKDFFTLFLTEYQILVETNFPTLKNLFSLYKRLPVELSVDFRQTDMFWRVTKNKTEKNKVLVTLFPGKFPFDEGGGNYGYGESNEIIFNSKDHLLMADYLSPRFITPLTNFVYTIIKRDFENIKNIEEKI